MEQNSEQQRMNLEKQLSLALQADRTTSQLKASKLHSYWKKICDDEKRAKQRNEMLMREFERIDAHMSEMNARTQRLVLMKTQYEDYISRSYPAWKELSHGSPSQELSQQRKQQQDEQSGHNSSKSNGPSQCDHDNRLTEHGDQRGRSPEMLISPRTPTSILRQEVQERDQGCVAEPHSLRDTPTHLHQDRNDDIKRAIESQDVQTAHVTSAAGQQRDEVSNIGVYQNLPITHGDEHCVIVDVLEPPAQQQNIVSQPKRSVEIQSKDSGRMLQSENNTMQPNEDEDDDTSEFVTDNEIPMAQSLGNTVKPGAPETAVYNKYSGQIRPELSIDGLFKLLNIVERDMSEAFSLEGYYRSSWPDTVRKNDIIRKSNNNEDLSRIDTNLISMVILEQITLIVRSLTEKCLLPDSLLQQNLTTLSAVKLRQHLSPEAQLVWDAMFNHFQKLVTYQAMEPHELSAIFTPSLVAHRDSQDRGHMFMVQLLEKHSNNVTNMANTQHQASPRTQTMEGSGSFAEDGHDTVPPLKFGSLLDKPMSDDESSYVKSSLPRDPVPLNETEAYKSMVSTRGINRPRHSISAQEDTDDDVEKQIATALIQKPVAKPSPRKQADLDDPSETSSMQTVSHVYVPTAGGSRQITSKQNSSRGPQKFQGVRISSDLDTDTEVDVGIFGSSKKVEDDFDFYD